VTKKSDGKSVTPNRVKLIKDGYFTIVFNTRAMACYEADAGRPVSDLNGKTFGIGTIAYLLHAGMLKNHPEYDLEDIFELLDEFVANNGDVKELVTVLNKALAESGWFAVKSPTEASVTTENSDEKASAQD
jgi:hypothetical protein